MNRSRRPLLVAIVAAASLAAGCATVPTSDVNVINSRENPAHHFFTPHVFATGAGTSFAVITQQTRIYANPTAIVKLAVFPTSNSSTTTCSISLSGHLMGL